MLNPWSIVVVRDSMPSLDHSWERTLAVEALLHHESTDLARFGGRGLAALLIEWTRGPETPVSITARTCLDRIAGRMPHWLQKTPDTWRVREKFPIGKSIPEESNVGGNAEPGASGEPKRGATGVGKTKRTAVTELERRLLGGEGRSLSLDLVWAIDCTGSMQSHLGKAVKDIRYATRITRELLGDVRVGAVTYRDTIQSTLPLTDNAERIEMFLRRISADKGGGPNERVDLALRAVCHGRMKWRRKATRAAIFVADAAPESKRIAGVLQRAAATVRQWKTMKIHAVSLVIARLPGFGPGDFWRRLTEAGSGTLHDAADETIATLIKQALPGLDEQLGRRILHAIERVEGRRRVVRPKTLVKQ